MHRDVILKCTAVKQMEGKFVMKLDIPTFWHAIVGKINLYLSFIIIETKKKKKDKLIN